MSKLVINGDILEGGGQLLRTAASCAVVTGQSLTVNNIRAGRPKPGLSSQHLKGLELVATMCGGRMLGAGLGSTEITLTPQAIRPGHYHADTETAGSVTLLLQVALPVALFSKGPTHFTLVGGTNADFAPPIDYTKSVFVPLAAKFGIEMSVELVRRGLFPRGGGEMRAVIQGLTKPLTPVSLTNQGKVVKIFGSCYISGLPPHILNSAIQSATNTLQKRLGKDIPISISRDVVPAKDVTGKGFDLLLWCETDTGVILGTGSRERKKNIRAEELGDIVASQLCNSIESGSCVDNEMQNQLIIFMGVAEGRSSYLSEPLSLHTKTAIHIMETVTKAKYTVEEKGNLVQVTCDGIGTNPDNLACNT